MSRKIGSTGKSTGKRRITKQQARSEAEKYSRRADRYREDSEAREKMLKRAREKANRAKGPLGETFEDVGAFIRLIKAYFSGRYRDVPWQTIALVIGALLYFLAPVDLIPDFIPVGGFIDDAAVTAFVLHSVRGDLDRFRDWETGTDDDDASAVPLSPVPRSGAAGAAAAA